MIRFQTALLTKVNMPYTLIRDTAPADLNALTEALKIVYVNGEGPKHQVILSANHEKFPEQSTIIVQQVI